LGGTAALCIIGEGGTVGFLTVNEKDFDPPLVLPRDLFHEVQLTPAEQSGKAAEFKDDGTSAAAGTEIELCATEVAQREARRGFSGSKLDGIGRGRQRRCLSRPSLSPPSPRWLQTGAIEEPSRSGDRQPVNDQQGRRKESSQR
jgi:hypothetical protein